MRLPLRPYVTTGVAIVGAAVLVVTPIAITPTTAENRDVEFSAFAIPEDADGLVSLLADAGLDGLLPESLLSGAGLAGLDEANLSALGLPDLSGLGLPDLSALGLPDLGELGLPDLGEIGLPAGLGDAFEEAAGILQAELETTPELLVLVVTELLLGNPDAENLLVQRALTLALDVARPFVDAVLDSLDPSIGGPLGLGYEFFDVAVRTVAALFAHRIPEGSIPVREDPDPGEGGEGVALATAAPVPAAAVTTLDDPVPAPEPSPLDALMAIGGGVANSAAFLVDFVSDIPTRLMDVARADLAEMPALLAALAVDLAVAPILIAEADDPDTAAFDPAGLMPALAEHLPGPLGKDGLLGGPGELAGLAPDVGASPLDFAGVSAPILGIVGPTGIRGSGYALVAQSRGIAAQLPILTQAVADGDLAPDEALRTVGVAAIDATVLGTDVTALLEPAFQVPPGSLPPGTIKVAGATRPVVDTARDLTPEPVKSLVVAADDAVLAAAGDLRSAIAGEPEPQEPSEEPTQDPGEDQGQDPGDEPVVEATKGGAPRLSTKTGGKFSPGSIFNRAGSAAKKTFKDVTGDFSDSVTKFGDRVKKFIGGGGDNDSDTDSSDGGDSGTASGDGAGGSGGGSD